MVASVIKECLIQSGKHICSWQIKKKPKGSCSLCLIVLHQVSEPRCIHTRACSCRVLDLLSSWMKDSIGFLIQRLFYILFASSAVVAGSQPLYNSSHSVNATQPHHACFSPIATQVYTQAKSIHPSPPYE